MGRRIRGNTDRMPCVEIKDVDLLESGVMVIGLGECGIFFTRCNAWTLLLVNKIKIQEHLQPSCI